jgi:hypothetical protein
MNQRVISAVDVLCWRWETYHKTGVLDNNRKYNTVDPDGADVRPTLQYRNRVRTFHHTARVAIRSSTLLMSQCTDVAANPMKMPSGTTK